ncbi:hypothetical protein EBI_22341 [Enterocytozoon bieneusi H348]|nr:hypothetical protein EBI_22341 [Enterocytozoon bieneusi H348]|eukprot:XP_002650042.1 hypothetical protein EBI_22341 [Enterocytozoon bieneusi H348]
MILFLGIYSINNQKLLERYYHEFNLSKNLKKKIIDQFQGNFIFEKFKNDEIIIAFKKIKDISIIIVGKEENGMFLLNIINFILNIFNQMYDNVDKITLYHNFIQIHKIIDMIILDGIVLEYDEAIILSTLNLY